MVIETEQLLEATGSSNEDQSPSEDEDFEAADPDELLDDDLDSLRD